METRKTILHDLKALARWVDVPDDLAAVAHSRDKDDDKFIHVAQAPFLVTDCQDLLRVAALPNLQVLTPAAALALVEFGAVARH